MNKKIAIIWGVTGQDGSYLSELLLEKGYIVHGVIRRHSTIEGTIRIDHLMDNNNFILHYGDVTDSLSISALINDVKPDEIYNLAAQSHVKVSFEVPQYTASVDALGTLNILECIRLFSPNTKFYQASTSELYGGLEYNKNKHGVYDETCAFHPRSPYGVAKIYGYWIVKNYRESYGIHAVNGILFNHESGRRGETFVTRKITQAFAKIKNGKQEILSLGNLDSQRDWGYAKDYVEGMYMMLQHDRADDFILATNETHTVREFVEEASKYCGWDIGWRGDGVDEIGYDKNTGKIIVQINPKYFRPAEVDLLIGDYSKIEKELGWKPKTKFKELVKLMMEFDLEEEKKL